MDIPTLAAARRYSDKSILGLTVIRAASVEVKSITPITTPTGQTGNRVTFEWTGNDGVTKLTDTMDVMDGISITNVVIDPTNNHLKITLSDGTIKDCGKLPSPEPVQLKTMPVADATNKGKVVQYIGNTTPTYTHNFFYECVEDTSTSPSTYKWENVNVQEGGGGKADDHWYGTQAEWDLLSPTDKEKYLYVHFTDDLNSGVMVVTDLVQKDNMNPVTSNAVWNATQGGGGAALTEDVTSNLAVGAIPSGTKLDAGMTFTEFVQKLLVTEVAPTIGFSITKSGNVVYGSSYTETLTVNVTNMGSAKSIETIEWYQGSTLLQTDTIGSTTTGSWSYTMATATTDTTTFKAIVKYKKSNDALTSVTKTASITFYYNKFYGSVASLTPSEADVTALTSALGTAKGGAYTFTVTDARIAYAYPASLGNLTSIKDGNGFSLFDSFTKTTETYTQNGTSVSYNLYVLTDATTVSGYSVIFA